MSANVEQEEVEAILDGEQAVRAGEAVGERDFRRPQRLSSEALGEFERGLARGLAGFARACGALFGAEATIDVPTVRESVADDLTNDLHDTPVLAEFHCNDQIAWLTFDGVFATRLVECLLGAEGDAEVARPLSSTETKVLACFLSEQFTPMLAELDGSCDRLVVRQDVADIARWQNVPGVPDPHRIVADADLGLGARSTSFGLWLPGVSTMGDRGGDGEEVALPGHLAAVDLALVVELPGCEVTLEELLALEVGDVIPLDAKVGEPVHLTLDGRTIARGALGTHQGCLATRILSFDGPSRGAAAPDAGTEAT